jgi:hypothetical protein
MKTLFTFLAFAYVSIGFAANSDLFSYDSDFIENEFFELNVLEQKVISNEVISGFYEDYNLSFTINNPIYSNRQTLAPWNIPSFLFTFVIAAVGTYTIYGAGMGVVAAGIVYISSDGNRSETKKASWGCLTGMLVGGLAKYAMLNLKSR